MQTSSIAPLQNEQVDIVYHSIGIGTRYSAFCQANANETEKLLDIFAMSRLIIFVFVVLPENSWINAEINMGSTDYKVAVVFKIIILIHELFKICGFMLYFLRLFLN